MKSSCSNADFNSREDISNDSDIQVEDSIQKSADSDKKEEQDYFLYGLSLFYNL